MLIDNVPYIGVPSIIQEIQKRIRTNRNIAMEKTADEEVRDYHTQILGNIVKNAEGKLEVKDRDDDDDQENMSAQLQAKFNKEIQKRGTSIGHGDAQQNQPSRQTTRDNDDTNYNTRQQTRPRANNITVQENDPMADAHAALRRISKNTSGEAAQDDALMGTPLARMGME